MRPLTQIGALDHPEEALAAERTVLIRRTSSGGEQLVVLVVVVFPGILQHDVTMLQEIHYVDWLVGLGPAQRQEAK